MIWLFPECIARMVEVGVKHPTVGIVSAYRLNEDRVDLDGLPYPSTILPGRRVGRLSLTRNPLYLFGSPTSILLRSDLIRETDTFYDESLLHADTDVCFRLLQQCDFGFVHQLLTYTRRHNESVTSTIKRLETSQAEKTGRFLRYGPLFLDEQEYHTQYEEVVQGYYRMLSRHVYTKRDDEFWRYHIKNLAALGMPFQWQKLVRPLVFETAHALVHFKYTIRKIVAAWRNTTPPHQASQRREQHSEVVQGH